MKRETGGGIKGTLNQTTHRSGVEEIFQLVSLNTYSGIMTWRSKGCQTLSYIVDSTAAFTDRYSIS